MLGYSIIEKTPKLLCRCSKALLPRINADCIMMFHFRLSFLDSERFRQQRIVNGLGKRVSCCRFQACCFDRIAAERGECSGRCKGSQA